MDRLTVLLTTEGTYPFHGGGVSTWCDALTNNLPEIDFTLLAVTMHPYLQSRYRLAPNVRALLTVPLWGIEEAGEYAWHAPFSVRLQHRWDTSEDVIVQSFLPTFEKFLWVALGDSSPAELGQTLLAMHAYFQRYDYDRTFRARPVWESFEHAVTAAWHIERPEADNPTLKDLTEALRLLYHLLQVLNFPVPQADVVHSAAAGFCGLPAVVAKLQRGTPYLLTEHGVYLREQYLGLRRHVGSFFVRWFLYRVMGAVAAVNYHFADQVSPVCTDNTRWEKWWGVSPDRIRVIYNGADPGLFRPGKRREGGRPLVASVGLIFPLKGQLDLIDAAALVRREIPDVEFRVYGSPSDQSYYEQCRQRVLTNHLEDAFCFAGATDEPWRVYQDADVIALSSISDAFPYTVIEAMLCGAAIVSTDVGGVGEALGEAGILVRPRRPAELARAIVSLLKTPWERDRLGNEARQRALKFFVQDQFLAAYRDTYRTLRLRVSMVNVPSLVSRT